MKKYLYRMVLDMWSDIITKRWTSGNKNIDDCIGEFQLRAMGYDEAIEWIPFNRLSDIKEIGKRWFIQQPG